MKTQRWELRCLAFFLWVAEANAFSAYKYSANEDKNLTYNPYRKIALHSLIEHIDVLNHGFQATPPVTRSAYQMVRHTPVSLGKNGSNNYIRVKCSLCKHRTSHRYSCNDIAVCTGCMDIHIYENSLAKLLVKLFSLYHNFNLKHTSFISYSSILSMNIFSFGLLVN